MLVLSGPFELWAVWMLKKRRTSPDVPDVFFQPGQSDGVKGPHGFLRYLWFRCKAIVGFPLQKGHLWEEVQDRHDHLRADPLGLLLGQHLGDLHRGDLRQLRERGRRVGGVLGEVGGPEPAVVRAEPHLHLRLPLAPLRQGARGGAHGGEETVASRGSRSTRRPRQPRPRGPRQPRQPRQEERQ